MSSKPKAELEQALNSYLSNRSAENITASANSTRKIVDLVRGGVSIPGSSPVSEGQTTASEEPEWMETLRNLAERCDPQSVENSGRVVNQLTKVSELIPGLVDQLATLANQNRVVSQPSVVNHSSPAEQNESKPTPKDETLFRSRKDRRLKGIRISAEKLEKYELWCMINKVSFQDAVEKALDWLTSGQPVNHVLIDDQDDDEEKDVCKSISSSAIEQKTTKINSFRYFLNSIREVARSHLGKSVSERMLQHTIQEIFKMNPEARQSDSRSSS
jgi:type II secretory pathway component PulM